MVSELQELRKEVGLLRDEITLLTRLVEPTQRTHSTESFGKLIGRSRRWVADRCRTGRIKSLTNSHPYKIPESELVRIQKSGI